MRIKTKEMDKGRCYGVVMIIRRTKEKSSTVQKCFFLPVGHMSVPSRSHDSEDSVVG